MKVWIRRRPRPLARSRRHGGGILAARVPDQVQCWRVGAMAVRAAGWHQVVIADAAPGTAGFTVWAIHDPRYREPLLVATTLAVPARVVPQRSLDRWPVEHLPLVAKQLIGAGRQVVHRPETCHRLPDLAQPERVYQVAAADLPADFPSLAGHEVRLAGRLSAITPLIGRVAASGYGGVTLKSRIGATRIVDMFTGEQLPRIC